MFDELRATPEVLYGAVVALRHRRPADARRRRDGAPARRRRPAGRRRAAQPPARPAARRARDLPRDHRPVARVPRPLGRDARHPARRRRGVRRRRGRRLPRPRPVAEARRVRCSPRRSRPRSASGSTTSRFPFVGAVDLPAWIGVPLTIVWIVAVMNMVNFLDGLDGLAAGVCGDRGRHVLGARALARQGRRGDPLRDRRGRLHRLPAPQLLPGADLHGRLGRARARLHARHRLGRRACSRPRRRSSCSCRCSCSRCRSSTRRSSSRSGSSTAGRSTRADRCHLHHRFLNIGFSQRRAALTMWALDGDARRRRARDALHPVPRGRRVASVGDARRRPDRARRARVLGLHRVPARDRQAREPARAPARGGDSERRAATA